MASFLIAAHVVAALLLVGPITVAASRFPRLAKAAAEGGSERDFAAAAELHRITRGYAAASVVVPALGLGVASYLQLFSQRWLLVSIVLTVGGAALLAGVVVPAQARALNAWLDGDGPAVRSGAVRAGAGAGMFGTVWVTVAVLMVVRPRFGQ